MDNVNWDVRSEHLYHATSSGHVEPADNTPDSTTKTNNHLTNDVLVINLFENIIIEEKFIFVK